MIKGLCRFVPAVVVVLAIAACAPSGRSAPPAAAAAPARASAPTDPEKVLNVYNWTDYIAPDIVPAFEKEYGIKVNYDFYDSNDILQTKLLTGHTGYDIVIPTGSFAAGQIRAGVFRKLDKALIPNLKYVDPDLARRMDPLDPGLEHSVNYFWGTEGVGYNVEKIHAAMANAPVDSLRMFYDPEVISHFKDCGVMVVDEPREIVSTVLLYLGRDGTSEKPEDLAAAEKVLMAIRPYIRYIDNERYLNDLANGEICLALGWSNDVLTAAARAREAGNGNLIRYNIPKEGAVMFIDMMGIPADSPHPLNAHLFINYLLRPEVSARNSSFVHAATSNAAAYPLVDPAVYNDRAIYPLAETKARLIPDLPRSQAYTRSLTRMWARFRAGR